MRQRERARYDVRDCFGGGVGQVVNRQDHDVVADPDRPVRAAEAGQTARLVAHRALLTLWTWT